MLLNGDSERPGGERNVGSRIDALSIKLVRGVHARELRAIEHVERFRPESQGPASRHRGMRRARLMS